jgi:ATP-dependent Zn protease
MLNSAKWPRRIFWLIADRFCNARATELRKAYHEAGHAVVAWARGETVEMVRISPFPPKTKRRGNEKDIESVLAVAHGGMAAEEKLTADPHPSEGADNDLDKIELILNEHLPRGASRDEWRTSASQRARSIVSLHWDRVTAVAEALLNEDCLDEDRFSKIVGPRVS